MRSLNARVTLGAALVLAVFLVLSALAAASTRDTNAAYSAGALRLSPERPPAMREFADLGALDAAVKRLAEASGAVKQRVIDAAAHVVAADGEVEIAEAELLRAIAAAMDVPLPPLVSGQHVESDEPELASAQRAEQSD